MARVICRHNTQGSVVTKRPSNFSLLPKSTWQITKQLSLSPCAYNIIRNSTLLLIRSNRVNKIGIRKSKSNEQLPKHTQHSVLQILLLKFRTTREDNYQQYQFYPGSMPSLFMNVELPTEMSTRVIGN